MATNAHRPRSQHSRSDGELRLLRQTLTDNSRFDKLLHGVRQKCHPDYGAERAELAQKHNAMFRSRASSERNEPDTKLAVSELRRLQTQIAPKQKAKKKKPAAVAFSLFEGLSGFGFNKGNGDHGSSPGPPQDRGDAAVEEEADDDGDRDGLQSTKDVWFSSGASVSFEESASAASAASESATSMGFFRSEASRSKEAAYRSAGRPVSESIERLPKVHKVELPQTLTLFLFRNGDRHHRGEAVFIQRIPKDMKELLRFCEQGCRPAVAPAEALFTTDMRRVRRVEDLKGGGVFLLKGAEVELDPPHQFSSQASQAGNSMKKLSFFQQANASAVQLPPPRGAFAPAGSLGLSEEAADRSHSSVPGSVARLPFVAGPAFVGGPMPAGCRSGASSVRREGDTWTINERLSWQLSYGGQVGTFSSRHKNYSQWPRCLPLSSRSSVNLSAAAPLT